MQQLFSALRRMPPTTRFVIMAIALVAGVVIAAAYWDRSARQDNPAGASHSGTILFCHWNMENLFDDRDDRRGPSDEDADNWFAHDADARTRKYQRMTETLLKLNSGIGPDIIVGTEVESLRAAELLRDALNKNLPSAASRYEYVAMKELDAGRHIAPCVISRFPLSGARLLGSQQRILEVHVTVNGHDLCIIGSHWTSQLSDRGDDESRGRFAYARTIHAAYARAIRENPSVDFLVCGDFNDTPDAPAVVRHLNLTGDAARVTRDANPPLLFGPLSSKPATEFGTHYFSGRLNNGQSFSGPLIYDQFGLSTGLLDSVGWSYVPDSVRVPTEGLIRSGSRSRRPWRFGSKNDDAVGRGFSDHFPIVLNLKVE